MSSSGIPVEEIARLAGHSNTRTTELVYRRELRPVLTTGAEAMDRLFERSPVRGRGHAVGWDRTLQSGRTNHRLGTVGGFGAGELRCS